MRSRVLGFLVWLIYRSLSLTWRVRFYEPQELKEQLAQQKSVIFAHWHGDELALIQAVKRYRVATLTSTSKDGEIMDVALRLLGAATSRGSSTRGGASALRALIKILKNQKRNSSFAVDGPKGPIYKVKPGVFELSRVMKIPIFPGGVAVDRAWHFPKAWNKTFLPKPFARVVIFWSPALPLIADFEDPRSPNFSEQLENALHYARGQARITLAGKTAE